MLRIISVQNACVPPWGVVSGATAPAMSSWPQAAGGPAETPETGRIVWELLPSSNASPAAARFQCRANL